LRELEMMISVKLKLQLRLGGGYVVAKFRKGKGKLAYLGRARGALKPSGGPWAGETKI
jgi:hypothetical protein